MRTAAITSGIEVKRGRIVSLFERTYIRRTILFCLIWFSVNLVYYGTIFFASTYFILLLPSEEDSQALLILLVVSCSEVIAILLTAFLISRSAKRAWISSGFLLSCALFFFLLLSTTDVFARAAFVFLARGSISGAFTTIYLWTPLVLPAHLRASGMGLMSSFGKIASICAPFISSSFQKENVLLPSILFGSVAAFCMVIVLFVGVEPDDLVDLRETKEEEDETTKLLK